MLSLFRTNQLILGVFLLGYALILRFWLPLSWGYTTLEPDYPLLSGWIYDVLDGVKWLPAIVATLLVWIQALLINSIVARNRLASIVNLFPGLFYILVCSALPAFQDLSPFHLANTFLILGLGQIFRIYKQNHCMDFLFNSGFYIGLASLFYGPYLLFLIPVLLGLSILRAFKWREWLAVIIGGLVPLLWLSIFGYLQGRLDLNWQEWRSVFGLMDWSWAPGIGEVTGLAFFAFLIVWVLINYTRNRQGTIIEVRKKTSILYWILLFGGVLALFSESLSIAHLLFTCVPIGILLSFIFIRMNRAVAEIAHFLLLVGVWVLHYLTYTNVI